jgi:hypothetical protein
MSVKKLTVLLALALFAQTALAQKSPAPGTHITVSKGSGAMYTSIQAAVNAAKPGQVIEILDESIYEEQVTIDGRDTPPWKGVTGGKIGITLRYVPPSASATARPSIRYKDITNQSPKTRAETQIAGDSIGQAGNWETCGALRILRTSGITIEGIIVDGGGSAPFAWSSVWAGSDGYAYPLFHGNSAITVVVSGNVQIRDCETRNAYYGMYVKDRNTGGVFANPNPDDIDVTVPLSGFGKTGNHLFEYNKIHDNDIGISFESSWDLGATIRYNLIYSNYHKVTAKPAAANDDDWASGAIRFKDNYLSPVAIYNNTFYDNTMSLIGQWQVGYQHLIFNNIFSKPHGYGISTSVNPGYVSYIAIEGMFPNRMKHCVFAADGQQPSVLVRDGSVVVASVQFCRFSPLSYNSSTGYYDVGALIPGALGSSSNVTFPADANIRWLETAGAGTGTASLPMLFKSITPTSPDFLVPDWEHEQVKNFIKNKGWSASGIVNVDGAVADLGAIPSGGKRPCDGAAQTSLARIFPSGVVAINGTTATADIYINQEIGSLGSLSIKYLRWIVPIPDNKDSFGGDGKVVPAASIRTIPIPTGTTLTAGFNKVNFTLASALAASDSVGFFELVLEGKDGNGNIVSSDVGFLPYRKRGNYSLNIEFFPLTGAMTAATRLTEVNANDPVRMRVTALNGEAQFTTGALSNVNFTLISAAAGMCRVSDDAPFTSVSSMAVPTTTYEVYFTREGSEQVAASGAYVAGTQALAFLGAASIKVTSTLKLVYGAGANGSILGAVSQNVLPGSSGETVVAVPDPGYSFAMWSDGVKTATRRDANVTSGINVTAVFVAEGAHVLLYVAGEGGTIRGNAIQEVAPGGSGAPVEAAQNPGYVFVSWSDGLTSAVRTDANIKSDVIFTAQFAKIHYLRYSAGANGALLGSQEQAVPAGSSGTTVVALPNPGYRFDTWSDGVTAAERTDLNVTADISVTARFIEHKYILSYRANSGQGVLLISNSSVPEFTERVDPGSDGPRVMAIGDVDGGYTFHHWSDGVTTALRQDLNVQKDISVVAYFSDAEGNVSVLTPDRVVPAIKPDEEATVIPPVVIYAGEFTAGPNPVAKQSGIIKFFRQGRRVAACELRIYDATGNIINKVKINDNAVDKLSRRQVGKWDLTDSKGRPVPEGTYLVKGVLKTSDGKSEKVSVVFGVR